MPTDLKKQRQEIANLRETEEQNMANIAILQHWRRLLERSIPEDESESDYDTVSEEESDSSEYTDASEELPDLN